MGLDQPLSDLTLTAPAQPRAEGSVSLAVKARAGRTRLAELRHQGSAKALLPRHDGPDLQAVLLNTAGGITGGDRFTWTAEARASTHLTVTTQAAERGYRAASGTGRVTTRLTLGDGARLHWLPQETILFDGASLTRRLEVDMAADATLLAVEPVIFGRQAMGETVRELSFREDWRIRRAGRLVYADALRIAGDATEILSGPATLQGHRAMASLILIGPEAEAALPRLRALLPGTDSATGGASLIRDGVLAARLAASDGFTLRRWLIPILESLGGARLPTPWRI